MLSPLDPSVGHKNNNLVWRILFSNICSPNVLGNNIENEVHISSAIVKYRDFTGSLIKAKIMGLSTPGAVNLIAKCHISAGS